MKFFRFVVGLAWCAAFVGAIAALVQGSWVAAGIAAGAWVLIGVVFAATDRSLLKSSARAISALTHEIGGRVEAGDWQGALALSGRVVQLSSDARQREAANQQLARPLATVTAMSLSNHCILLGANGRFAEAEQAAERVLAIASLHGPDVLEDPEMRSALLDATELLASGPSQTALHEFRLIALDVNRIVS